VVQGQVPVAPAEAPIQSLPRAAGTPAAVGENRLSAAAPAREGVSADDLRQYRLSLATVARRFKRYPALARERGWEGTVDVALNFSSRLPVPETVLVRSSGRSLLDEQALEMIAQAARVTSLPEGMKGHDFRVLIPVKFSLEGDQ
jgi:protein TonB